MRRMPLCIAAHARIRPRPWQVQADGGHSPRRGPGSRVSVTTATAGARAHINAADRARAGERAEAGRRARGAHRFAELSFSCSSARLEASTCVAGSLTPEALGATTGTTTSGTTSATRAATVARSAGGDEARRPLKHAPARGCWQDDGAARPAPAALRACIMVAVGLERVEEGDEQEERATGRATWRVQPGREQCGCATGRCCVVSARCS
eukprot:355915-Chlamydomonas_euryale.AAC.6